MEKLIAFDFGGVLDVKDSYLINESSLIFRCLAQMDEDKAYRFFDFALKNEATVFCISDLAHNVKLWQLVTRKIMGSTNPEYAEMIEYIKANKRLIRRMETSFDSRSKQGKIDEAVRANPNAVIVAFEDDTSLSNCNHVWISKSVGLTDENVIAAGEFFK